MTIPTDQNSRVLSQFAQQARSYANLVNRSAGSAKEPLIEALDPQAQHRVLDVGCGTGQFVVTIAPLVREVVGVDLTPAMLDQGRALQIGAGVTNVEWRQGDSSGLPVTDGAFDIVTSRSMLHHAANPAGTIAEMVRACAPGGRVAVLDLTPAASKAPAFDAIELLRDPSHARTHTHDELRALGESAGLREVFVTTRQTEMPLEMTLATSFPEAGVLDRVRDLYARDADAGLDALGFRARWQDGKVLVTYPMTMIIWTKP
jgi:ubiquinone/menaquinone biosynthesis C-methylase UbiE